VRPLTLCRAAVKAAADFNILGIISFSVFFAVVLSSLGPQADPIINTINILNAVIERMVKAILSISPLGIASIIAARVISTCSLASMAQRSHPHRSRPASVYSPETRCSMGLFMFTVIISLAIHTLAVLPLLYFLLTRRNPYTFMRAMSQVMRFPFHHERAAVFTRDIGLLQAFMTAFGTSSSVATLPVTIQCCERAGISPHLNNFVLPLGATVNMNGTALYEALSVVFLAQTHGVTLSAGSMVVVFITSVLAAAGAAAIPSAGLVTMVTRNRELHPRCSA